MVSRRLELGSVGRRRASAKENADPRIEPHLRPAEGFLGSGVGNTSQEAIASALKLALRQLSESFHAAEVQNIHLMQYPWFFLARVTILPHRILQGEILTPSEDALPLTTASWPRRLPLESVVLNPDFASVIPQLRLALISSQRSENSSLR